MSTAAFKDHFSARASGYAAFRPTYPPSLFAWLASLVPRHERAWDAGTGNGQAATGLAAHFAEVVATDASAQQIANAEPNERITYGVRREAESGLPGESCDLVTAAQALHWFDIGAFYAEATRVLRYDGAVAVWTYAQPALDDPRADAVLQRYVELMRSWWPPERAIVESGYRTLPFPFREVVTPLFDLTLAVTLPALAGYLRTWSAHQRYLEAGHADPVIAVESELRGQWPEPATRLLRWPLSVRAGYLAAKP